MQGWPSCIAYSAIMEPPCPPLAQPVNSIIRRTRSAAACSKLRLICSYGGRISLRPRGKPLCYVGGDTRLVVVDRNTSLLSLSSHLSQALLDGRPFALKYQLPGVDLDSLVSVVTDEDLENMIDEYDQTVSSPSSRRLRLFLFTLKSESTRSVGMILQTLTQCEARFTNELNGAGSLNRVVSADSVSVNSLLGLDDNDHPATDAPGPENASSFWPDSSAFSLTEFPSLEFPMGTEDQFTWINLEKHQKKQEDDRAVISSPPEKFAAPDGSFTAGTMSSDHPVRSYFEDERSDKVANRVSDHPVEPRIYSYEHKPRMDQIQNSGYSSQPNYEKQQPQERSERRQQIKTVTTASPFDIYEQRTEYQRYPIYCTPVWPIRPQMVNRGFYGMASLTEYSPPLVHFPANQGTPTAMVGVSYFGSGSGPEHHQTGRLN